jgi:HEAT repeat protein
MTPAQPDAQLVRLASDNTAIYQDAYRRFLAQGSSAVPTLIQGLDDSRLGLVCHWRILLLLREFALPATLPAILRAFHSAVERDDPIVLPGAMEALAVFRREESTAALISVLQSANIDRVHHAAALLSNIGGSRATEALAALLHHEAPALRKTAVRALRKMDTSQAREILERHRVRETDADVISELKE